MGRREDTPVEMDQATSRLDTKGKTTREVDLTARGMMVTTRLKAMERHIKETTMEALKMPTTKRTKSTTLRRKRSL